MPITQASHGPLAASNQRFQSIPARFVATSQRLAQAPAYFERDASGWQPTTWTEYAQQVRQAARALVALGVQPGDAVCILGFNRPEWTTMDLAAMMVGAVAAGIYWSSAANEIAYIVEHSGCAVLLVENEAQWAKVAAEPQALARLRATVLMRQAPGDAKPQVPEGVAAPMAWEQFMALGGLEHDAEVQRRMDAIREEDIGTLIYTSGTTGHPKGCMHTHRSVMYNTVAGPQWLGTPQDAVSLVVLPLFHVTGMQNGMNGSLYVGATIVLLPRWDRDAAAQLIGRYRVTGTQMIVTMVVDLLSNPRLAEYDLSSISRLSGGGAAMPEAVATRLKELCNLDYIEGYGMSETMAPTHINPPERPMKQCLGIPIFDVDARVVDPATFAELPPGEVGEIIVHGPQVMQGYWGQPAATEAAFVTLDGKRFLRTGDLARTDKHGYFYMVDRLKRMINASGFKVWPAEVEALMYAHPAIQEVCVIAARDERRGETVKAVVVLRDAFRGQVSEQEIVDWAHGHMAAYKSPRLVSFVDSLPKSGTGKVQWRALQEQEQEQEPARTAG